MQPNRSTILSNSSTIPFEFKRNLSFSRELDTIERDYGIVHGFRPSTPYPRVKAAVNPNTLQKRLVNAQNNERRKLRPKTRSKTSLSTKSQLRIAHLKEYKTGTEASMAPVASAISAVSAASMASAITSASMASMASAITSASMASMASMASATTPTFGTSKAPKSSEEPEEFEVTEIPEQQTSPSLTELIGPIKSSSSQFMQHIKVGKKVVIVCPRNDKVRSATAVNIIAKQKASFEERRRLFHRAEFTIAKNGRKMCDTLMVNVFSLPARNSMHRASKQYHDEIEKYIQNVGIIKSPSNLLFPQIPANRKEYSPSNESYNSGTKRRSILIDPNSKQQQNSTTFRNISFSE